MAPPLFDPKLDVHLWDAVFGSEAGLHWRVGREVRAVRRLFVQELGWTRPMLERYRFRMVAEMARSDGEVRLVELKAPADYARSAPQALIESVLGEMTRRPLSKAKGYFRETLIPVPEVKHIMRNYRITLSDDDYELLKQAAAVRGIEITGRDPNVGNPNLSLAIVELIRDAYLEAVQAAADD